MALDLQGNIERFALPEIFQFIAGGAKTGTLAIQSGSTTAMAYFRSGMVIYSHCSPNNNLLGDVLVQNGRISESQLGLALKNQNQSPSKRIGEIFVEMGFIELSELQELLKFQVKETLYNVLTWESGTFKFYENRFPTEEKITVSISTENIILEGMRRFDELSRIQDSLPPLDSILKLAPASDGRKRDIELEAEEWNLLSAIDGYTSINRILEKVPMGRLEALGRIKAFLLAGLVIITEAESKEIPLTRFEGMLEKLDKTIEKYLSKSQQ